VESLAARPAPIGRLVPIDAIDPSEPAAAGDRPDRADGVDRPERHPGPLVVRQRRRFQIIAGERRYQAARSGSGPAGRVRDVDDAEMLEIALIENLQRKDLTPFEEGGGDSRPGDELRVYARGPARRLGKSRTSLTESLALRDAQEIRNLCRLADISLSRCCCRSFLGSTRKMAALVEQIDQPAHPSKAREQAAGRNRGGPKHTSLPTGRHQGLQPQAVVLEKPRLPRDVIRHSKASKELRRAHKWREPPRVHSIGGRD
jgi:ParB family chromosome partitioning protein